MVFFRHQRQPHCAREQWHARLRIGCFWRGTSTLTLTNLQTADAANFVVVVTNVYGAVTSSVASLVSVSSTATLAFWNFNQLSFPQNFTNPAPWYGVGTAFAVNCSPFSGATDPADGPGFGLGSSNYSWGTDYYPTNANGSNKLCGVQFNVSTVGAKNIAVSYDSRASATASDYERLQYTTNGTTWTDFPASSTFNGHSGSGNSGFLPFSSSLAGFPGVANNPNFGIRVVTEFQSTATYGAGVAGAATNYYIGTANTYGTSGSITYDIVNISGDAITSVYSPPVVSSIPNTNALDNTTILVNFTASDANTPADQLSFSAVSLNSGTVSPSFTFGGSGTNRTLLITPNYIPDSVDAAPIMITVTDANGDSTATWFTLTLNSLNQAPTNSLTSLKTTNMLANTALTIPFTVSDDHTPANGQSFSYTLTSDNNTLVPSGNIVISNSTPTNATVTITPATNQFGVAQISVTVNDNDLLEPKFTTANFTVMIQPNANVVLADKFNYDSSGALDAIASGFWTKLSGDVGQMKVGSGSATVDTLDNIENMQVKLLGSPFNTNSGAVLYAKFTVNMNPNNMPIVNGTYFALFNDGSGVTGPYEGRVIAATNGAAPGYYRLGINNFGATATSGKMFPQDLSPNSNYVVVASLVLSNGFSTLWINPSNQSSPSVTDTTPASAGSLYNISDFELRESGQYGGSVSVGNLVVGQAFNSVFYPAQANPDNFAVTENSGASLLSPLSNDAGSGLSLVSVTPDSNGTATISGTGISFTPTSNFIGTANISYTIQDNLGDTSSSTIAVVVTNNPPLANPDSYTVTENSASNVLNPLTNDMVETSGGSLSLVSVTSPANGTATISGNQVLYTPNSGFTGVDPFSYTVTDNVGGTNSSLITVAVVNLTPVPVSAQLSGANLVLSWTNTAFSLQTSTNVAGPYITIPGATSPYTNLTTTNAASFFRLVH